MEKIKNKIVKEEIIQKMVNELEEEVKFFYGIIDDEIDDETMNEITREMTIIAFYRLIKLNILSAEVFDYIYRNVMKVQKENRTYVLLSIYRILKLQNLLFNGIITHTQFENLIPKLLTNKTCDDYLESIIYIMSPYIEDEFIECELLDENTIFLLYKFVSNIEINEVSIAWLLDELLECDNETRKIEIKNLITRLTIRNLRQQEIITESDETMFMSLIEEYKLTYEVFEKEDIAKWKSKAYPTFIKKLNGGVHNENIAKNII